MRVQTGQRYSISISSQRSSSLFLIHSDFSRVERQVDPTPLARPDPLLPPGYRKGIYRPDLSPNTTSNPTYYKIHLTNSLAFPSRARSLTNSEEERGGAANDLTLSLEFEETRCLKRDVLRVSCQSLQCGMRPRAVSHRARSVTPVSQAPVTLLVWELRTDHHLPV